MKIIATFLVLIVLFLSSCAGGGNQKDLKAMRAEVMAVHDEVMPKMGELRKVEKSLRQLADEKVMADSTTDVSAIRNAADAIAAANESMMVWMRAYNPNFEGTNDEVAAYIEGQQKSVDQVKKDMLSSLEAGKALLAE